MNQTNQSHSKTDPWVESGAMVYVALTVATLSSIIMCCVWFLKKRLTNKYGIIGEVELNQAVSTDSGSEEEIPLDTVEEPFNEPFKDNSDDIVEPPSVAFTLEDSSEDNSDEETHLTAV